LFTFAFAFYLYICREYRHNFATSIVAHLCLPNNVANTMLGISDGHGVDDSTVFVDALMQDNETKVKTKRPCTLILSFAKISTSVLGYIL